MFLFLTNALLIFKYYSFLYFRQEINISVLQLFKSYFVYKINEVYIYILILNLKKFFNSLICRVGHTFNMSVSYTHLRAHETSLHLVCRLLLEKILLCFSVRVVSSTPRVLKFFNDTATTEIYTLHIVGSVRCV